MSVMESSGKWFVGTTTAAADTAFTALVPPHRGDGSSYVHKVVGGLRNAGTGLRTYIESAVYIAGGTAHSLVVMRPLNWAVISADVAANATTMTLETDPGAWGTASNYKYRLPPECAGIPSSVAANAIAANDYVTYQLKDGTWQVNRVSSVSSLTLTLTTAVTNVTGGGVVAGTILYFFGASGDTNPLTGKAHDSLLSTASARTDLLGAKRGPALASINAGDPILLYSANATAQGWLASASGYYAK